MTFEQQTALNTVLFVINLTVGAMTGFVYAYVLAIFSLLMAIACYISSKKIK